MKKVSSLLVFILIGGLFLGGVVVVVSQAQTQECRFFNDTGHYVCDEFLEFYTARGGLEGGLEIFGYPLTEAFDDPRLGSRVQYFQRARMEWHPDNQSPYKVQLGLLVDELGYSYPLANAAEIPTVPDPHRLYFSETGHIVSYAFLDYFREKGGADVFGYPRSELLYEDGYYVQYFQRARMEWHPEDPAGRQVRLTNIGENYTRLHKINTAPVIRELRRLRATASVRHIIADQQSTQTVFVYVMDQYQNPVESADVVGSVRYQGGELDEQSCQFEKTNAEGLAKCQFGFAAFQPGQKVIIDITATRDGLTDTAQTFFFLWW